MPRAPRSSHAYRTLCRVVRREERTCWICQLPIDTALPYRDPTTGKVNPMSWSLDHVVPLSKGGAELERWNARAAHFACNSGRGNRAARKTPAVATLNTSRDW